MPRNIVVCCDGTNNQFGICNTNVVRLLQIAVQDAERQIVYYDPGVGTLPEPGLLTRAGKAISRGIKQAFATDIEDKVGTAYAHLMEVWRPGDQVYLFGFSRGAYTARVLAGLLHALGLLPAGNAHLLPYVMKIFGSLREDEKDFWSLCDNFRWSFARPLPGRQDRRFPIHFVGVWDTVSSVGWVWEPASYPFTHANPSIEIIRHAVSLDERRWFFRQNLIGVVPEQDSKEHWFAGVHSDVGGGYPESDSGFWRVTFSWIMSAAKDSGLLVDEARLKSVLTRTDPPTEPWNQPLHESLKGWWWLGEIFPKMAYDFATKKRRPAVGLGGHRFVHEGAQLDRSLLERLQTAGYCPPNLTPSFIEAVKRRTSLPESIPYSSGNPPTVS
jgi:uncharacterized protein (DUF2235 family)